MAEQQLRTPETKRTEVGSERPPREKRLLLISYHFGPGCATGGFRWNATADYLCNAGWDIDVITLAREGLERRVNVERLTNAASKSGLDAEQHCGRLEIFPVKATRWPSAALAALISAARWLREHMTRRSEPRANTPSAPNPKDLRIWAPGYRRSLQEQVLHGLIYVAREATDMHWAMRARRIARALARRRRYRAVVVCSPPQITQVVGEKLSLELGIPYVADYRDPWILGLGSLTSYYLGLERLVGRYYEKRTLKRARIVIHNTERARAAVARELDLGAQHFGIPNGYDETDDVDQPDPDCFRVIFTGHLHPFMDVRPVFEACAQLRKAHHLGADEFRIEFIGAPAALEETPLTDVARAYGLGDVFSRLDRISKREIGRYQEAASVLVAFDSVYPIVVPSKFYEYARMKGTMLLIGNRDGAFNDAASKLGLRVFDPSDQAEINEHLEAAYARWRAGGLTAPMDATGIFDRRHQSQRIAEILERLS